MKMTKHPLGTLVETDVLVIGSGASGCGAALGARDQGLDVVLMDKGKLESSGCIGGGNDHYMAVLDEPGEAHDTVEDLIKFYAKPLNGWSPAMLQNGWYAHMKYFLDVLGKAGVQFSKKADGTYLRTQGFGQPGRPASCVMLVSIRSTTSWRSRSSPTTARPAVRWVGMSAPANSCWFAPRPLFRPRVVRPRAARITPPTIPSTSGCTPIIPAPVWCWAMMWAPP